MKPYEFKRFYHPKLGKFVYQHKGSGLIVDNIFKPLKSVASSVFKKFAKPIAKKALESGISHAGERLGKAVSQKSGDLIMKRLANLRKGYVGQKALVPSSPIKQQQQDESTDMILNRLISGSGISGIKRRRYIVFK